MPGISSYYCIVNILLICSANQWGGFYVMVTLVLIGKVTSG